MTAGLPDRAADREREVRLSPDGELVAIRRDSNDWRVSNGGHYRDIHVADWQPLALAARPAPDDGEARVYTCRCSSLGLCPEHAAQDAAQDAAPSSPGSGDAQLAAVRDLTARAYRAEAAVERVREFVDGFADRGGGHVTATDELWILSLRRALNSPQSPPSHTGRAEGGGRMYSGGSRSGLTSQDETEGRR